MSYLNSTAYNIIQALRTYAPIEMREGWAGAVEIEDSSALCSSIRGSDMAPTIYISSEGKEAFETMLFKYNFKFLGIISIEGEYKNTNNVHVYEIENFLTKLEGTNQLQAKKLGINTLNVCYDYVPAELKALNFSDRVHWLLDHNLLPLDMVEALANGNSNTCHYVLQQRLQKLLVSDLDTEYFKLSDHRIKNLIHLDSDVTAYQISGSDRFMGAIDKTRVILSPGDGLFVTTKVAPRTVGLANGRIGCITTHRFDWANELDVSEGLVVEARDRHVYENDVTIEDYYHAALRDLVEMGMLKELKAEGHEIPEFSCFVLYYSRMNTGYQNYIHGKVEDLKLIATIPYKDQELIPGVKVSGKTLNVYQEEDAFGKVKLVVINEDKSFDVVQAFKDWLRPLGYSFNAVSCHCMGYGGTATSINITSGFDPLFSTDLIDDNYVIIDKEPEIKKIYFGT